MKKLICLLMVGLLCMQSAVFAAGEKTETSAKNEVQSTWVQPRGRYLQGGECSIAPNYGYVTVSGRTDAFEYADKVTIKLTLFQEISPGSWLAIWSDSKTGYDTYNVGYPSKDVWVEEGYRYKVEGTYTVTHNGVTESNSSETAAVYAY